MENTTTHCPTCGVDVEPGDPGLVYARRQVDIDVDEYADGGGMWFHKNHCPSHGWRLTTQEEDAAAVTEWREKH